jgi:UDP-N-acetyl-D-glucosamine/UDP-N-acetyl-D-galactosamine dehydrogenase
MNDKIKVAVIGLGYVGLPLAIEVGKKYSTIGFDINKKRISELKECIDSTEELSLNQIKKSKKIRFTYNIEEIKLCNFYIIAVPTPINKKKKPNLKMLRDATYLVANILKKKDIVVYESTVYPGLTEEYCVPILEKKSKLKINKNFSVGYSPERINVGDKKHTLTTIKKIVSASNSESLNIINNFYKSIIKAGTYKAPSIKVAEAAKVIENSQRDINIALVNELSMIFSKLGIDTNEVIDAAKTKWNFLPFYPGIVGGHCIGVDPYYLSYKAEKIGYKSKIILAGRKLNDEMGNYIAKEVLKLIRSRTELNKGLKIAILGLSFKENCGDIRNTKVIDIKEYFLRKNIKCDVYDPVVNKKEVFNEYGIKIKPLSKIYSSKYNAVIIAVKHNEFKRLVLEKFGRDCIIYDVKSMYKKNKTTARL